jgi:hypothetical protein
MMAVPNAPIANHAPAILLGAHALGMDREITLQQGASALGVASLRAIVDVYPTVRTGPEDATRLTGW